MRFILVLSVLALGSCNSAPPTTVAELADALRDEGIGYTSTENVRMPSGNRFRFDEGIALSGDQLWVELIRIEDERVFGIAKDAAGLLVIGEAVAGRAFPGKPEIYPRQPFIVVVRQEPAAGEVLAALNKVMPE